MATVALRNRLEGSLVNGWLQTEATNFLEFKRVHPEPDAPFLFTYRQMKGFAYRPTSPQIPFAWRDLPRGVHDLH